MGETNPRLLALLLEDLTQDLEQWGMRAADLAATAELTQRQAKETVTRLLRLAGIAIDKTQTVQLEVAAQQSLVDSVQGRNGDATINSKMLLSEAQACQVKADRALLYWQAELSYAQAWEARATQRVAKAEQDLAHALAALQSAEYELAHAIDDYNRCVNYRDDKGRGRNCAGEAARVHAAQAAVAAAKHWVQEARAELASAKAELARAQARVRCTEAAVELATKAAGLAAESVTRAHDALSAIERSSEAIATAQRDMQEALTRANQAVEQGDLALAAARQAHDQAGEADMHLRTMVQAEENAQRMRIYACTELIARIGHLYLLDRPDSVLSAR